MRERRATETEKAEGELIRLQGALEQKRTNIRNAAPLDPPP